MDAPPQQQAPDDNHKKKDAKPDDDDWHLQDFAAWMKEAEKDMEEAPFHTGDLPPEDNQFGSYYIPRILGPDDAPLPDMPWDNTGPNSQARERILILLKVLRRSGVMAIFFERLPKNLALGGFYNYVFDLQHGSPWKLFEDLSHLVQGDVIEIASHDWTLLIRTKAWCNFYENPLEREKYWRLKKEEEQKAEDKLTNKMPVKKRLLRLEIMLAKNFKAQELFEQQRQAIALLLMLQKKYKFNSDMHEYMRENIAYHERDIIGLKRDLAALKILYEKLVQAHVSK